MHIQKRALKSEVAVENLGHKKAQGELVMEVYVHHYGEVVEEHMVLVLPQHIFICCHFILE